MSLYLKIDQDENFLFFEKYDTLSPLRKKIWQKISEKASQWPICRPSQTKIAAWCGCSRSAVSEAFRLFKEWGWLSLHSNGYKRSKTLLISHSKRQMDVTNRKYFKQVRATYRATYTTSKYITNTSRKTGLLEIPKYIEKLDIPLVEKLKLSLVSEATYQETLYRCKKKSKSGWKAINEIRYFVETALKIEQNKGTKLEWKKLYRTLEIISLQRIGKCA